MSWAELNEEATETFTMAQIAAALLPGWQFVAEEWVCCAHVSRGGSRQPELDDDTSMQIDVIIGLGGNDCTTRHWFYGKHGPRMLDESKGLSMAQAGALGLKWLAEALADVEVPA